MTDDTLRDLLAEALHPVLPGDHLHLWADCDSQGRWYPPWVRREADAIIAALAARNVVLVRKDTGGVFLDGTTNTPSIDFKGYSLVVDVPADLGVSASARGDAPTPEPPKDILMLPEGATQEFVKGVQFGWKAATESTDTRALDVERLVDFMRENGIGMDRAYRIAREYAASQPVTEDEK